MADALRTTDTPAHRIAFEVTESSLIIDLKAAITTLSALQELGCRTSADDFGTGYASLQYLQQLPLDEVKIDQSFIIGCLDNPNDQAIVRSTTHLIHELGLEVVAEGVEDVATPRPRPGPGVRCASGLPVQPAGAGRCLRRLLRLPPSTQRAELVGPDPFGWRSPVGHRAATGGVHPRSALLGRVGGHTVSVAAPALEGEP